MKPIFSFFIFLIVHFPLIAQETYQITYEKLSNHKKVTDSNPIRVIANAEETVIGTENSFVTDRFYPNEIHYYHGQEPELIYSIMELDENRVLKTVDSIGFKKIGFKKLNQTKRILGLRAKHAQIIINSNTIDLWYVDHLGIHASPVPLGLKLGFVLEFTRNNNYTIRASKIEYLDQVQPSGFYQKHMALNPLDPLTYSHLVWKNKFKTIPLLARQQIHYDPQSIVASNNDSIFRYAHGTVVVRKVKMPYIDHGSQLFLDVTQVSNGDAYDRTGSVFIIPQRSKTNLKDALEKGLNILPVYENGNGKKYQGVVLTKDYEPVIELMRFFTPFGIGQFNHVQLKDKTWHLENPYRQDISEFRDLLSDQEVYIGFFIGNYDQGGHMIDANLTIHNSEKQLFSNGKSLALFNTLNVMEMAGQEYPTLFNSDRGIHLEFELKEDWKNAKLRLITTGHGGWGNGDEFVPKLNSVFIDDKLVFSLTPWRQDCGSYRLYNPASGNFDNGLSSSDYSRSNWCPGTVTTPYFIQLGDLKAGKHTVQVKIPQGEPEGNSFSSWAVSGVLLGE